MFYHPEVLRRHTGFFGTIWLAATCSSRLLRREYMGVDVPRVCASVLSFVLGRGLLGALPSPPPPGAPPPRCSLYLAALLQLGLARVYGRQCGQLLEEASLILERLHRARPPPNIDISPPRRPQLVGDARALMATLESAPDPFFGLMEGALPSPTALPHVQRLLEELPPPPGPPITVSPELITLREPEAPRPAEIEEGLPEVTARELELLSEAEVELLPPAPEIAELPAPPPVPLVPRVPEEPSLPLAPEVPPFRRPLRDRRPQLEERGFRERLEEPRGQCRALEVLPPPRDQRRRARDLLSAPLWGWLPPELWVLWSRCARPTAPPPPPPRPPAPPELPSDVEALRELLEPSVPTLPSSEVTLEVTEEELPRPWVPIPEERPPPPLDLEELRRRVVLGVRQPEGTELGRLLPHGTSRRLAGRLFALCLELCGAGLLSLTQPRPFGPIALLPGPRGPPPL